jgi:hypothetical protein
MQKFRLTAWIELAAVLSVLMGLFFVAQELRQNNQYAKSESVRDLFQMWSNIHEFEYENRVSQLVRKSIKQPDELSDDEILQIGSFLAMVMNAQLAQATMEKEGGLVVGNVEDDAPEIVRSYFSSHVSRAWLKANGDWIEYFSPEFYEALIVEIEKNPVPTELPELERIKSHL